VIQLHFLEAVTCMLLWHGRQKRKDSWNIAFQCAVLMLHVINTYKICKICLSACLILQTKVQLNNNCRILKMKHNYHNKNK
jgi:hypothetical protein